jgi:DNA-binding MarR family transcriptional regulator
MSGRAEDGDGTATASVLEVEFGFRLGRVHRMMRAGWEQRIHDLGVTPPQAATLRALCESPGSGLRELGRRTHTDAMNVRRLVERLEHLELVTSTADPAHRQRHVLHPTRRGIEVADELAARAGSWNELVARLLGADESAHLLRTLTRLETILAADAPPQTRGAR